MPSPSPLLLTCRCASESLRREDIAYRYYDDVDALKVYFARTYPGLIRESNVVTPNIIVDLDENDKVVVLEVKGASQLLACHFRNEAKRFDDTRLAL